FSSLWLSVAVTHCQNFPPSLHDALPICAGDVDAQLLVTGRGHVERGDDATGVLDGVRELADGLAPGGHLKADGDRIRNARHGGQDRKSTRLNSSHVKISYAVFCLKKKKW